MSDQSKPGMSRAGFKEGPFAVVVTNPGEEDGVYPLIVAPDGGFASKDEAEAWIQGSYAERKEPFLGLHFAVTCVRTPGSFNQFCSWED